jgi:threonylcarbamoyladenosine tRNA methylthiotransferase MtaB
MRRNTTPESFRGLVSAARASIPDVAITTDIIAGFPGETQQEFAETLEFVRRMEFAGGHVFTYSARPGTGAAKMKGQVKPEVRKTRNRILTDLLDRSAKTYRGKFLGRRASVLWESVSVMGERGWQMEGWTENYLRAQAFSDSPRWNKVDDVTLIEMDGDGMQGVISKMGQVSLGAPAARL